MKEEKRKRILRVGCLILAGIFALSMLGSVVMMLLVGQRREKDEP